MGEEEATKAQARKTKEQQDQSGTDQRWVMSQTEMQVVPCLAAAHGEQRGLGFRGVPALAAGQRPAPRDVMGGAAEGRGPCSRVPAPAPPQSVQAHMRGG